MDLPEIIGRKTTIKIEREKEMTGGAVIIRMGTHKETTERTIKIENSITTSKSNKEIIQKDKVDQMIIREKEGNNIANINNKT